MLARIKRLLRGDASEDKEDDEPEREMTLAEVQRQIGGIMSAEAMGGRQVTFERGAPPVETPLYRREALRAGADIRGPAIVEQMDTTTLIWPGFHAVVDTVGNLIMERATAE